MNLNQKENEYIHTQNIYKRYYTKFQHITI